MAKSLSIITDKVDMKLVNTRYLNKVAIELINGDISNRLKIPMHPGIENVYGVIMHNNTKYSIVTKHIEGKPLSSILKSPATTITASNIVIQIADALSHLHRWGSVHGDLQPDTIIVTDSDDVVLIDGGLDESTRATGYLRIHHWRKRIGPWMAPEVSIIGHKTKESDLFSLGVVMWTIATRQEPFSDISDIDLIVKHHVLPTVSSELMSKDYLILMRRCLDIDSNARPTATEVAKILRQNESKSR